MSQAASTICGIGKADQTILTMLRFNRIGEGPDVSVPRERTGAPSSSSGEGTVPPMVLDTTNDPTTRAVVINAVKADDPKSIQPTSVLTSVASGPLQWLGEEQTGDLILEQKVKTTLEAAMGTTLHDLVGRDNNPQDIQERVQEKPPAMKTNQRLQKTTKGAE